MSYPPYSAGGPGYPNQPGMPQPGDLSSYPGQQGVGFQNQTPGYPPQGQPGYPPQGQPGYPPQGPPGGQPGYPPAQAGYPPAQGGYPPAQPAQPGYPGAQPAQGGYPGAPPAQAGYPGAPPAQAGYPGAPPAQGGYPGAPPAQAGYPGAPPAQAGYPGAPPAQAGYPGAPPAQGGYPGAPPAQAGYPGAPPAQAGYPGAPPAQGGYPGAPPAQGGYPGGQQPGYSSQSAHGDMSRSAGFAKTQGTITKTSGFNAEADSNALRKAMKGFGTDEATIINILSNRTLEERLQIKQLFKTMFGKDLIKELKSELSGKLETLCVAMLIPMDEYYCSELNRAIKGAGTDESDLIEIMCSRSNQELEVIKVTYKKKYGRSLETDLNNDTSGHFKRLMVALCSAGRQENQQIDPSKAEQDANILYQAGEKKFGTDESKFNYILCSQSFAQLRLVFDAYQRISGKPLEKAISSEMSGYIEKGILTIIKIVRNTPAYFAEKLYHTMKGMGTCDRDLIRVLVTRCEVDMVQIKHEFQIRYSKSLEQFIKEDTSGDYSKMLRAVIS